MTGPTEAVASSARLRCFFDALAVAGLSGVALKSSLRVGTSLLRCATGELLLAQLVSATGAVDALLLLLFEMSWSGFLMRLVSVLLLLLVAARCGVANALATARGFILSFICCCCCCVAIRAPGADESLCFLALMSPLEPVALLLLLLLLCSEAASCNSRSSLRFCCRFLVPPLSVRWSWSLCAVAAGTGDTNDGVGNDDDGLLETLALVFGVAATALAVVDIVILLLLLLMHSHQSVVAVADKYLWCLLDRWAGG